MAYFSSVCWFFGREISDRLETTVPLGLISNNVGGTEIELWQPGGSLYNAMIHPYTVGPMAISGFAWYQGEANTHDKASADAYAKHFPAMIRSWREAFRDENEEKDEEEELFFGFVQLSTWCVPNRTESIPRMREAQMSALDLLPNIGYATNADHGHGCDIHPPSKQHCGKRLGRSALALRYGHRIRWKSPSYDKSRRLSSTARTTTTTLTNAHSNGTAAVQVSETEMLEVEVSVVLRDVSPEGLYLLDVPYNERDDDADDGGFRFDCSAHPPGICGYPSILLNDGGGWRTATLALPSPSPSKDVPPGTVTLRASVAVRSRGDSGNRGDVAVLATSYGWGGVPMMTLYDRGTDLPVLPWKEPTAVAVAGDPGRPF